MSPALTILGLLAVAGASGCRRAPEFDFRCPGGPVVAARYTGDSVALRLPEGTATLPRALSASGARYANDTLEFWEHAGEVRVTRRGHVVYSGCRTER